MSRLFSIKPLLNFSRPCQTALCHVKECWNEDYLLFYSSAFNGGVHKKYNAKGDINILIDNEKNNVELVTLAVNGGQNGLPERQTYFESIKKEWGLE